MAAGHDPTNPIGYGAGTKVRSEWHAPGVVLWHHRPMGFRVSDGLVDVLHQDIIPRLAVESAYPDVVFRYRHGRYWRGACPLHGGKDPNFSVDTETLSWSCFTHCGHGSYLAYRNGGEPPRGQRFVELVRELGDQVGVRVDTSPPSPEQAAAAQRHALLGAFADLAGEALSESVGAHVVRYLASRGFPDVPADLARLGFGAYPSREMLRALRASELDLAAAGLDSRAWMGRLLIPWRDEVGRVATIAARTTGDDEPRYLYLRGASRPPFFVPGRRLAAGAEGTPVVVEGLIDALLLRYAGVPKVLGTGGTAVGDQHTDWLVNRGIQSVVLVLDNDDAGRLATRRWIQLVRDRAPDLRVHAVPGEAFHGAKDPAELLEYEGLEASSGLLDARLPALAWLAADALRDCAPTSPIGRRRDALQVLIGIARTAAGPERLADLEDLVALCVAHLGYSDQAVREAFGIPPMAPEPGPPVPHDDESTALADDVVRVVRAVGGCFALHRLAHTLRNSSGSVTRELVMAHAIEGLPSRHLRLKNWLDDRDAIRSACLADPRLGLVDGYWAVLADRPDNASDDGVLVNAGRSWTAEEDAMLRARWGSGLSVKALGRLHGRTDGAIRSRLMRLGLQEPPARQEPVPPTVVAEEPATAPSVPQEFHRWDPRDESGLRSAWLRGVPLHLIASSLGRTDRGVEARLVAMGLVRTREQARALAAASGGLRAAAAREAREDHGGVLLRRVERNPLSPIPGEDGPRRDGSEDDTADQVAAASIAVTHRVPAPPMPIAGTGTRSTPCPHGMPRDVCKACNQNRYIPTVAEGRFGTRWAALAACPRTRTAGSRRPCAHACCACAIRHRPLSSGS